VQSSYPICDSDIVLSVMERENAGAGKVGLSWAVDKGLAQEGRMQDAGMPDFARCLAAWAIREITELVGAGSRVDPPPPILPAWL